MEATTRRRRGLTAREQRGADAPGTRLHRRGGGPAAARCRARPCARTCATPSRSSTPARASTRWCSRSSAARSLSSEQHDQGQREADLTDPEGDAQVRRARRARRRRPRRRRRRRGWRGRSRMRLTGAASERSPAGPSRSRPASCSASSRSAARRPPSSRSARSPCSAVNSRSAAPRRARTRRAAQVEPLAVLVERVGQLLDPARRRQRRHRQHRHVREPTAFSAWPGRAASAWPRRRGRPSSPRARRAPP